MLHPEEQVGICTPSTAKCFGWDFGVAKNLSTLSAHLQDSRQTILCYLNFPSFSKVTGGHKLKLCPAVIKIPQAFIIGCLRELGPLRTR